MESRRFRRLASFLAGAVILGAAAGRGYGGAPGEWPAGQGIPPSSGSSAAEVNRAANPTESFHEGTDPSRPPASAAAYDNAAAASPVPPVDAAAESTAASGDAGDGADLREPSFGEELPPVAVSDPIEPVNRGIHYVNDKLYRWVFKPVAKGYRYVAPEGVRHAVRNFFSNLGTPIRAANTLLQGKFKGTGTELARFTINSTIGVAGLFDVAKKWNLRRRDEDTGQTLGVYGIGHGAYIVLPVLGPSSARDAVGIVGDTFLDPLTYLPTAEAGLGARAVRSETDLTFRIDEYDELTGAAVDPYIAVRDAYIQYRERRVRE